MNSTPVIFIPEKIKNKWFLMANMAKGEISWIGEIEICSGGVAVKEIFLIEQETTPTKTTLKDEAYAQFLMQYLREGGDVANLKLWCHSHGDMPVFWSVQTDEATIETHNRADFFVSVVVNRSGQVLARIDIFKPFRMTLNNVAVVVVPEYPQEMIDEATQEIAALVHFKLDPVVPKGKGRFQMVEEEMNNGFSTPA